MQTINTTAIWLSNQYNGLLITFAIIIFFQPICLSTLYLFTIFKLELPNPQISLCVNECTVAGPVHPSHSPLVEANHRMVFFLNIILSAYPVQDGNHYAN